MILIKIFQANKQLSFWKQRYQGCNNQSKIELFSIRTKLSYNKIFFRKFLTIKTNRIRIHMSKPVYLVLSILKISKIVIYEFWRDYMKSKYGKKAEYVT